MESGQTPRTLFIARLALGLVQGLALYLLYSAFDAKTWPSTVPELFGPLVVAAIYIPFVLLQGIGNLRAFTLTIWVGVATAIVGGLTWYSIWNIGDNLDLNPHALPYGVALFVCGAFLFVAHALVSCGDTDRRIIARYATLFDLAWKLGVQIAIAACFVLSFWLMLWLGIALFNMIKLFGFARFIEHPWVSIPLTTIAAAVAIHVTDTRAALVRGVRTLALTLLGWLLPVITAIAFAFLISLTATGLQPLWETRAATALLIAAAAVLVIHINAAYQDGDGQPHHLLRVAGTLASVLLVFLVFIAAYALWLRVNQYGWTVDRITTAGIVTIAAVFALGYLIAAIIPGQWLKFIERWNVYGTLVALAVLFALATPIADPLRLSVNDQVARLKSGAVSAAKFDFDYLRYDGGRFGKAALEQLASSSNETVAARAKRALRPPATIIPAKPASPAEVAQQIRVLPSGRSLPPSFVAQDWRKLELDSKILECFQAPVDPPTHCDAIVRDFDGDGRYDVLLIWSQTYGGRGLPIWASMLFVAENGRWVDRATTEVSNCIAERDALLSGKFALAPANPALPDIVVPGGRLALVRSRGLTDCK